MKCIKKQDLVLFYYEELKETIAHNIKEHIDSCSECRQEFENMKSLLEGIFTESIHLEEREIEDMIKASKQKPLKAFFIEGIALRLIGFIDNLKLGLAYRKPLVPVVLTLVLLLGLFSVLRVDKVTLEHEFNILEIQMELSLEEVDQDSIFELYDDPSIFQDNMSKPGYPNFHKYSAIVRQETSKLG